jgi:aspartate-semialdehyde dehydrogenase
MKKIDVAVLGAGYKESAQKLILLLEDHPWFNTVLVADSADQVGKKYKDALKKWLWPEDMPSDLAETRMLSWDPKELKKSADIRMVLSLLPKALSKKIDPELAKAGIPVVSDSPGMRDHDDIPNIVPEINSDHLTILESQMRNRNWESFLITSPLCTATILALSLKPIVDSFGLKSVFVVTQQALSGAGYWGIPSLAILDNMIPYITREEDKMEDEIPKTFGKCINGKIIPSEFKISSTCNRVNVSHGHTESVFVETEKSVDLESARRAFIDFKAEPQKLGLPSAPKSPILVREEQDRPQPRIDRDANKGMGIVIGRIREEKVFENGFKYVVLGHNHIRGTAGNTLICGELLYKKGLIK